MKYVVNWIPLRIRVHSRNTQPHLKHSIKRERYVYKRYVKGHVCMTYTLENNICILYVTGWRRLVGSPKLQIIVSQKSH